VALRLPTIAIADAEIAFTAVAFVSLGGCKSLAEVAHGF
jgi:hypothetical protein